MKSKVFKKVLAGFLILLMAVSAMTGCASQSVSSGDKSKKIKLTIAFPKAESSWEKDDYFRYITDKANINIDFRTMPSSSAMEKARIWINAGDMPDALYMTNLNIGEYLQYGEQGLIKAMPADFDEKYPNLGFANAMTGVYSEIKERANGELYVVLRPSDHYKLFINEFRQAYAEGKDLREMMDDPRYMYLDMMGFAYRKDWAEQLGIKTDLIMDYDDVMDMALKFKEADLGGVGKENTVGIAVDYTEAPNVFVRAFNPRYKYFHKDENGKYICGLLEESTTVGLRAYVDAYRKGIISPSFYTQRSSDLNSVFCSQKAGIIYGKASIVDFRKLYSDFEHANPGLVGSECLDICWFRTPDGNVAGFQSANGGTSGWLFNPDLSDEKLARFLELADYCSSPEGGPQVRLGVPDKDYKYENGEYVVTREKNAEGVWPNLNEVYPSYDLFRYLGNPHFEMPVDSNPYTYERANALIEAKRGCNMVMTDWDTDLNFYQADDYAKFSAAYDVNNMFAEIVVSKGDTDALWEAKRAELKPQAESVAANMNAALIK